MIDKTTIDYINPALKFTLKQYLPLKEKILLYDALLFCSVVSKVPMLCSESDYTAFKNLISNCKEAKIPLENYLSCAYSYISDYCVSGHRLGIGYFLNDKVIEYCGSKIDSFNESSLFLEQVKEDILQTEKQIRNLMIELSISYEQAFRNLLKNKKISQMFLAYKKFCCSPLVGEYASEYFNNLVEILDPFFTYILAKNGIFTPYKIQEWNNSKIEDFNFCPIYFKDRYVTNELTDDCLGNSATTQGTKIHSIFEAIFKKYNKNKIKDLKQIALKYFKSTKYLEIKEELSDHISFIEDLFTDETSIFYTLINKNTEILIEHKMTSFLSDIKFYGTADLILINQNKAFILDYKSSKLDPKYLPKNNHKYNKQISLYAKLLKAEQPNIETINGTIIYTRGLIHPFPELNNNIDNERALEIESIKKTLKSGVLMPKTSNCFLCRHPNCNFRKRESIWDSNGQRKNNN